MPDVVLVPTMQLRYARKITNVLTGEFHLRLQQLFVCENDRTQGQWREIPIVSEFPEKTN